eukprot:scaffold3984_cov103-Isochrysis_galbana.AAC.1
MARLRKCLHFRGNSTDVSPVSTDISPVSTPRIFNDFAVSSEPAALSTSTPLLRRCRCGEATPPPRDATPSRDAAAPVAPTPTTPAGERGRGGLLHVHVSPRAQPSAISPAHFSVGGEEARQDEGSDEDVPDLSGFRVGDSGDEDDDAYISDRHQEAAERAAAIALDALS